MIALALALGTGIGMSLGLLGGGGSILTVPALVYVLGRTVHEAVPASLLVVGSASAAGAVSYIRSGCVPWRTAALFGSAGIAGSFAGAYVNHRLAEEALLLGFALLMVVVAFAMLRRAGEMGARSADCSNDDQWRRRWLLVMGAGSGTGLLTGLFGVGGGFVIVPALVLLVDLPIRSAIGASLLIIVVNSVAGLLAHLGFGEIGSPISISFAVGGVMGAVSGEKLAGRIAGEHLIRGFSYLVLAVAVFMVVQVTLLQRVVP